MPPTSVQPDGSSAPLPSRLTTRGVFWGAFALFAALSVCWALASPIFAVPDESAHAVKAVAQAHGELVGHRQAGARQLVMDVPAAYSFTQQVMCFVAHPNVPADCGAQVGDAGGRPTAESWVSTYNPLYYYLVGWPSLFLGGPAGIYAMRIVSAIIGALLFAWAVQAGVASRAARWLPMGLAFAGLPMIVYLNGAINPNGLEIVAALALTVSLLRLLETFGAVQNPSPATLSRRYLWTIITVSAILLACVRALGPLWVLIVVALCLLATPWQTSRRIFLTRRSYLWLAIIAVGGLFSVSWTLAGGSLSGQAAANDAPLVGSDFLHGALYIIRETPTLATQTLGYFGWFDAPLPGFSFWFAIAAITILAAVAFASARRRDVLTLVVGVAVAALVPVLVQAYSVGQTGIIWQGRYGLFVYLAVIVLFAWVLSQRGGLRLAFLSARLTWAVCALLWIFESLAFFVVLHRYVVGAGAPLAHLFTQPAWQPPLGAVPLILVFEVVSAAFFVFLGLQAQRLASAAERP